MRIVTYARASAPAIAIASYFIAGTNGFTACRGIAEINATIA